MEHVETTAQVNKTNKKQIIAVLFAVCVVALIVVKPDVSLQTILMYTPANPLAAAGVILGLYLLKSFTFVIPYLALQLAAGYLFSPLTAIAINVVGCWICLTVPYWMGRFSGGEAAQKLVEKYPKFRELVAMQQDSSLFFCFFLRAISCLPADIVTLYLGATRTSFIHNIIGGTLGMLPGMVLATVLDSGIKNPASPAFWLTVLVMGSLSVGSFAMNRAYQQRRQKQSVGA